MTRSNQGTTPRRHSSLGLDSYVQFSSPIRRYTDMLAHYQIKVGRGGFGEERRFGEKRGPLTREDLVR